MNKLPNEIISTIRKEAFIADQQNALTTTQWQIIKDYNWINIWLPKDLGGNDLSFPEIVRQLKELAWVDGTISWTVTLCSGANWFAGFLQDPHTVFQLPNNVWAGSGQANGILTPVDGGYLLSGEWQYATGIENATHITFNAKLKDSQEVWSGFLYPHQIKILYTWNKMGMRGTGTHNFAVDNVMISPSQIFRIEEDKTTHRSKVFKIPFQIMAMATLTANYTGMFEHFWEEALLIAEAENKVYIADKIHSYQFSLNNSINHFLEQIDNMWNTVSGGYKIDDNTNVLFIIRCKELIKEQYRNIHEVFPHLGMQAVDAKSMINLIWRDLYTASQHAMWRS